MKIMVLANEGPEDFALRDETGEAYDAYMGEWYVFSDVLKSGASIEMGAALEGPAAATVVSVRDGKRLIEDGPYPDTKEQLGGFFMIDAPDMETAVTLSAKCPAVKHGFVDVRAVPYLEENKEGDAS